MAKNRPYYDLGANTPRELHQYVVAGEKVVFATRRHWAQILEPVGSAILGLLFIIGVATVDPTIPGPFLNILFVAWFILLGRAVVYAILWWSDWFVATTSRLLLSHGIIYKKVAMMPLAKVTDMSYNRTIPGRLLGYGQFVMESAGQDQALREVNFVPNSGELYRQICSEIFHKKVANQVYRPVALLNRTHRASEERGYEPWENARGTLDLDERAPASFPDQPTANTTQEIDIRIPPPKRPEPKAFDDDEDYDD